MNRRLGGSGGVTGPGGGWPAGRRSGPGFQAADYRELVASILTAEPGLKTLEVLRRTRLAGYRGGKSALYALIRELRPRVVRLICRFEGIAGEFTQHDFRQVWVCWTGNDRLKRVQFFCSRLKFSRFSLVVMVDNQRTEILMRSMAEHFERMGGIPLLVVFDRATTPALKSDPKTGEVLEWNPVFADATQRMDLGVDVCWPARLNQQGSVDNVVGWVKGSFFKVRQFHVRADLEAQLADWLVEINERRPGRATRCVRAELLVEERQRLRPLRLRSASWPCARRSASARPPWSSTRPKSTRCRRKRAPFPARCTCFRDRVRTVAGCYHADHPRLPAGSRGASNLPAHRQAILEAVSGKRGRQYYRREHLFQLGLAAKEVITEIIYAEQRSWNDSIERLHELFQLDGDDALRASFERLRGKTLIATAIAYQAIVYGHDALFATANDLVAALSLAARNGRLRDVLAAYIRRQLPVVDDVGNLDHGPDAADVLFHVVDERHRRLRAIVFTTTKPLDLWVHVLHDPDLDEAILDRILERGRIVTLE